MKLETKYCVEYYEWFESRGCGLMDKVTKIVNSMSEVQNIYEEYISKMYESDNEELILEFQAWQMIKIPADYYL